MLLSPLLRLGLFLALLPGWVLAQPAVFDGLRLQDHRLKPVTARALAGEPLLLNFVFAGCTTVCPVQLHSLQQLRAALPAEVRARVQFVSVTVDPLSDSPQALAAFARARGLDEPGWRFVSGAPAQVHQLLDRMQVFGPQAAPRDPAARPDPADHRSSLYLFGADGQLVQRFRGDPVDLPRLQAEIAALTRPQP